MWWYCSTDYWPTVSKRSAVLTLSFLVERVFGAQFHGRSRIEVGVVLVDVDEIRHDLRRHTHGITSRLLVIEESAMYLTGMNFSPMVLSTS